jgi:hypothetical protein
VSLRAQQAPEMVRATARLHRSDAARQLGRDATTLSRRMRRRITTRPVASSLTTLQLFLPKSIPRTCMSILSSYSYLPGYDGEEGRAIP